MPIYALNMLVYKYVSLIARAHLKLSQIIYLILQKFHINANLMRRLLKEKNFA